MQTTETLEELEKRYFMLEMQDRWESEDYRLARELREKIREVEASGRK